MAQRPRLNTSATFSAYEKYFREPAMLTLRFTLFTLFASMVQAQSQYQACTNGDHSDIYIEVTPPGSFGGKILLLNEDPAEEVNFPLNIKTGSPVALVSLRAEFAGLPFHKSSNPGWRAEGQFLDGETLWFRALGTLRYWDPTLKQWGLPPAGERVRYFNAYAGSIPTTEEEAFFKQGTIWSGESLNGPLEAPIVTATPDIHTHLDFCLEAADGDCSLSGFGHTGYPTVGAYLIEMQLFSDAGAGTKYIDSRPIQVLLNNGLTQTECDTAIASLVAPAAIDTTQAQPGAGVLIMSGY